MNNPKDPLFDPDEAKEGTDVEDKIEDGNDEPGIPTSTAGEDVTPENIRDDGSEIPESRSIAEPIDMRDENTEGSDLKHEDETHPD